MHGQVVPYTIASGVVGPQATATALGQAGADSHYFGFSLRDTAGDGPVVRIRDSGAVSGKIVETISFLAGESVRELWPVPVVVHGGVFVELVSGTLPEGTLRLS